MRVDLVYSWCVLHDTPDTPSALREVLRVLRPGGRLKAMIFHVPSWPRVLLQAQHGWLRGRFRLSHKDALFQHLESPGTKTYSLHEAREMLASIGWTDVRLSTNSLQPICSGSSRAASTTPAFFRLIFGLYPRWLVQRMDNRYGLNLMSEARRPGA